MRYAIFDLDGTIVDSMGYWRNFDKAFAREHNIDKAAEFDSFTGVDWVEKLCLYFNKAYNLDITPEKFMEWGIDFMMKKYANDVDLKPGAKQLLESMKANGVKMCICSSTDRYMMEPVLKKYDLDKYFEFTEHCRQYGKEKDEPDIFMHCMSRLGADDPSEVAVFEDALYSASTAKAAGFYVVGMYDVNEKRTEELKKLADQYVTDYIQLDCSKLPE